VIGLVPPLFDTGVTAPESDEEQVTLNELAA
jgi:hypothetical protein